MDKESVFDVNFDGGWYTIWIEGEGGGLMSFPTLKITKKGTKEALYGFSMKEVIKFRKDSPYIEELWALFFQKVWLTLLMNLFS